MGVQLTIVQTLPTYNVCRRCFHGKKFAMLTSSTFAEERTRRYVYAAIRFAGISLFRKCLHLSGWEPGLFSAHGTHFMYWIRAKSLPKSDFQSSSNWTQSSTSSNNSSSGYFFFTGIGTPSRIPIIANSKQVWSDCIRGVLLALKCILISNLILEIAALVFRSVSRFCLLQSPCQHFLPDCYPTDLPERLR